MAYFLSPVLNEQQFDANGEPRAGALITTYLAGTLTPVATYKTSTGTAQTNPIQLDSSGNFPNGTQLWLLGGLTYKFVITDSTGANSRTYDNISGIGDNAATADEWVIFNTAPTYISATSFSVAGDQTNILHIGRKLKSTNTGGTVYSTISNAVFAAGITTVTVINTSGVLDSGLSQVNYALLDSVNPSLPDSAASRSALGIYQAGYLFGCTMSTAGASVTMNIAAGAAVNSTGVQLMTLAAIAKTNVAWAVGTAVGGLDTGAIAPNTGYHFFVIRRPDTGIVDALFSLSATAPTLPANYTQFRRIGWGRTNGSNQWTLFVQDGDFFQWASPTLDINLASAGTAAVARTLTVPLGVNVRVQMNVQMAAGGGGEILYMSDLATTDLAPTSGAGTPLNTMFTGASSTTSAQVTVRTNTSGQIRTRQVVGGATETFRAAVTGYFDDRGKNA